MDINQNLCRFKYYKKSKKNSLIMSTLPKFKREGRKTFTVGNVRATCRISDDGNMHVYVTYKYVFSGNAVDSYESAPTEMDALAKLMQKYYAKGDYTLWSY